MPVLLVGSLAISTLGLVPLAEHAKPEHRFKVNAADPELAAATGISAQTTTSTSTSAELDIAAVVVPTTYTVLHGDTVSEIAGRYALSTASVLALNGLGWKSLIFPGQVLRLSKTSAPAAHPVNPQSSPPPTPAQSTPPPATTAPASATPASSGSYSIQRGDTITAIAKKFGVSVAALLAANSLSARSIIYTGRTLQVPGLQLAVVGAVTVPLSPAMRVNAQTIIAVGRSLGVPDYGIVVALAAAAQESRLHNLSSGDRDSVGLFQQRPSTGWGSIAQLTTPTYAAELFFGGPRNPNRGRSRGLLDIAGWQSMTVTRAAQAVQISGSPNAYAKWEASARAWLAQLG